MVATGVDPVLSLEMIAAVARRGFNDDPEIFMTLCNWVREDKGGKLPQRFVEALGGENRVMDLMIEALAGRVKGERT